MPRHDLGDGQCLVVGQTVLFEHEGDLGLRLAGSVVDLVALVGDLRLEDLALALAADVLAGAHAEDARQPGCDAGDEHGVPVARGAGHGAHDREGADEAVLRAEDRLADLTEDAGAPPFFGQVSRQEVVVEVAGRHVGTGLLIGHEFGGALLHAPMLAERDRR